VARSKLNVSIILPIRNAERYLDDTFHSLLSQTYKKFEILAIDDGSKDGSCKLIAKWVQRDKRIRPFYQKEARGLIDTLNAGLACASHGLIARADADDLYHPQRLEQQVNYFAHHPDIVLLGARTIKMDSKGRILFYEYQPEGHDEILQKLVAGFGGVVPHPVAMFRREAALKCGGYRSEAAHWEDTDLWLRLSEFGRLANVPQHLVYYRVHHSSVTALHWREARTNARRIATEWARQHSQPIPSNTFWDRPAQTKGTLAQYWAQRAFAQGNKAAALREAGLSVWYQPLRRSSWSTLVRMLAKLMFRTAPKPSAEFVFGEAPGVRVAA
jgi:glycosyltransferase involved in cell wall biosynthesis